MYEIGRLCVKLAGRDAGKKCVIIDILKDNYVMIDGSTRRRKCNTAHLEPLNQVIKIKKKATNAEVIKAFKKLYNGKTLFPIISNQKINKGLKRISALCGFNKKLTFHSARHTFATTVTLTNGVPIETVSKMLGHNNIKTTQIYARVIDSKVSQDMLILRQKFI